jgi:hypothetical protein
MQDPTDRIRELKTEAKNQRDRGIRGFSRAVQLLEEAASLAGEVLAQSAVPAARARFAAELSDCHGMVGGVQRRWALESPSDERTSRLRSSCVAYDKGFKIDKEPKYAITSSYNRLNRLTARVLLVPHCLAESGSIEWGAGLEPIAIADELAITAHLIESHLSGAGAGDYWAMADLALARQLLGQCDASRAYADFIATSPPGFALASVLDGLRPLAALPIAPAPTLQDALHMLEGYASRMRT